MISTCVTSKCLFCALVTGEVRYGEALLIAYMTSQDHIKSQCAPACKYKQPPSQLRSLCSTAANMHIKGNMFASANAA